MWVVPNEFLPLSVGMQRAQQSVMTCDECNRRVRSLKDEIKLIERFEKQCGIDISEDAVGYRARQLRRAEIAKELRRLRQACQKAESDVSVQRRCEVMLFFGEQVSPSRVN